MGVPALGTRLGLRHDRVAAARSVAKAGSVEKGARELAGPPAGGGQDRLVAGGRRLVLDPCFTRGKKTGRNPTDRGRKGSKHHIATDANGIPLAATLTGANEHDVTQMIPLVDAIPAVRGKPGRPRRRPERVQGDRAYDSKHHRAMLHERGIEPVTARRNTKHGSGLGKTRWVVERTVSWLHQMRRLRLRAERRADIHEAFMALGCIIVTGYFL